MAFPGQVPFLCTPGNWYNLGQQITKRIYLHPGAVQKYTTVRSFINVKHGRRIQVVYTLIV